MFFFAVECPVCGAGTRGFRLCSDKKTIVVMCDECDSVWLDPSHVTASKVIHPDSATGLISSLKCGIGMGSRWATREEIERAGWGDLIAGEGSAMDD
jgi:hypothetical protein